MNDSFSPRILIEGGGVAAWMAACALAPLVKRLGGWIRVVEDAAIDAQHLLAEAGTTAAPDLRAWHRTLSIDERQFMRSTRATFHLGVEVENTPTPGRGYFHYLGEAGAGLEGTPFHQHWLRLTQGRADLAEFSLNAVAARQRKFVHPSPDMRSVLSTLEYGYQLDPRAYRDFLRRTALELGAASITASIRDARLSEHGLLRSVSLDSGEDIEADLFLDCSTAQADGAMARAVRAERQLIDCEMDRMLVTQLHCPDEPPPFSRLVASPSGWTKSTSLQGFSLVQLAYASSRCSDDAARAQLRAQSGSAPEPVARFALWRRTPWTRNYVALGRAAAHVDPLGYTQLQTIRSGVARLLQLFPTHARCELEAAEYNRLMTSELDRTQDFLAVMYSRTFDADDAGADPLSLPGSSALRHKLRLFRSRGRVIMYDEEMFNEAQWIAALLGRGILPRSVDPLSATLPAQAVVQALSRIRTAIHEAAAGMPSHGKIIAQHCAAEPLARGPLEPS